MDLKQQTQQAPMFHPSMFQGVDKDTPNEKRTLVTLREQRSKRVQYPTDELVSPGKHQLTPDDTSVTTSNTKHLFKNLHEETLLTYLFFSQKNIQNLQDVIKFLVHRETKYVLDKQSVNELMIVMRSIFLEYNAHPPILNEKMDEATKDKVLVMYKNEVARLNEIVINAIVPKIISQLQQYVDYLRDAGQQPYQMEIPKSDSVQGRREYRSVTQILLGGEL